MPDLSPSPSLPRWRLPTRSGGASFLSRRKIRNRSPSLPKKSIGCPKSQAADLFLGKAGFDDDAVRATEMQPIGLAATLEVDRQSHGWLCWMLCGDHRLLPACRRASVCHEMGRAGSRRHLRHSEMRRLSRPLGPYIRCAGCAVSFPSPNFVTRSSGLCVHGKCVSGADTFSCPPWASTSSDAFTAFTADPDPPEAAPVRATHTRGSASAPAPPSGTRPRTTSDSRPRHTPPSRATSPASAGARRTGTPFPAAHPLRSNCSSTRSPPAPAAPGTDQPSRPSSRPAPAVAR